MFIATVTCGYYFYMLTHCTLAEMFGIWMCEKPKKETRIGFVFLVDP